MNREARSAWMSAVQVVPLVLCVLTLVLAVAAALLGYTTRDLVVDAPVPDPRAWFIPVQISGALIWSVACLALMPRRDLAWCRLAALAGLSHAVVAVCYGWAVHGLVGGHPAPGAAVAGAMALVLLPVEMPVGIFMYVSLPSGRLTRRGWDRVGWTAVILATAGVVVNMVSRPDVAGTAFAPARNPLSLGIASDPFAALLIAPAAAIAMMVLVGKWLRSRGPDRIALRWVVVVEVLGTVVIVPLFATATPALSVGVAQIGSAVGLLVLVTAIRRRHVLGVERLLERGLRLVCLASVLALVYAGVIAAGSDLLGGAARPLAAAVVAVAVLPLRDLLSGAVARFVYGDRADATEIVAGMAARAANAASPSDLIQRFLDDLIRGTGISSAVAELDRYGVIGAVGEAAPDSTGTEHLLLRHGGAVIGRLRIAPATGDAQVDPVARRVAREVAPHIAIVADSCRAEIELQRARTRLIEGREEERRRLRHDLHDGLGPILTGVAFSADAASNLISTDPDGAAELITTARHDVTSALDEIRRIVEDLRPPALDELGLAAAIRQHAQRLPHLEITVSDAGVGDLPAAVEVAAYRIATEALTNVARHAHATRADVGVVLNGSLALTVTDDGTGTGPWAAGVGLTSMGERARELGGALTAGPSPRGGVVTATLPVDTQ